MVHLGKLLMLLLLEVYNGKTDGEIWMDSMRQKNIENIGFFDEYYYIGSREYRWINSI